MVLQRKCPKNIVPQGTLNLEHSITLVIVLGTSNNTVVLL